MGYVLRGLGIAVILAVFAPCAFAYSGGDGSVGNPYQIADVNDFMELTADPNNWDMAFILTADIDLEGISVIPIGNSDQPFRGVFDGNGNIISNFTYLTDLSEDKIGLFGEINGSEINNLGVEDIVLSSAGSSIGGIAGSQHEGVISNCYVTGEIFIIGEESAYVGGMVGSSSGSVLINCYSKVNVYGYRIVGGLAGYNDVGYIAHCYSSGFVEGYEYVGGLIGYSYNGISLGNNFWDINTSGQSIGVGGGNSEGVSGKTTLQMKEQGTFLAAGWDFMGESANGTHNLWKMSQDDGYPENSLFRGYIPVKLEGNGTEDAPYIINDVNDLGTVWYRPFSYYVLANDINLEDIYWTMPVVPVFYGVFNGSGHKIVGLSVIYKWNYSGFFGKIKTGGEVRNLALVNSFVSEGYKYIGALTGYNEGNISDCYVSGELDGTIGIGDFGGGLVGYNSFGDINNCFSMCDVNGSSYSFRIGGLVGCNDHGCIRNCYSTGSVKGIYESGGLLGKNFWGDVLHCFWDTETSERRYGVGDDYGNTIIIIAGKTTAQMKTLSTFTSFGWDFANTWAICEGTNYPRLRWQIPAGDWVCPDGVRMEDFGYLAGYWMETTPNGDLSGDGVVGIEDLILFCDNWMGE